MRLVTLSLVLFLLNESCILGQITATTSDNSQLARVDTVSIAQEATEFALLYGYALSMFMATLGGPSGLAVSGTNRLISREQGNSTHSILIRGNTDTAYAAAIIDLAVENVVLSVPPMQPDRFYLFAFYDPYGDDYASLGSVQHDQSGNYLLRPALESGTYGYTTENCLYVGCINSPTSNGLLIIRVEHKYYNNATDQAYITNYINSIGVNGTSRNNPIADPLTPEDIKGLSNNQTIQVLQLLARIGDRNPPQDLALATKFKNLLPRAGIKGGKYKQPAGVNLAEAENNVAEQMHNFVLDPNKNVLLNEGWYITSPKIAGSFNNGTDLSTRAYIGKVEYLQNTANQAIYPSPAKAIDQNFTLSNGKAYMMTFSGKPPIDTPGFWSITLYNSAGFFSPNAQNIYALGDRSQLTYPDGELVYGMKETMRDDPFQILIQSTDNPPPRNWSNNWLPSPKNGRKFQLTLRLYVAKDAAKDGSYIYPKFEKQKAL